MEPIGFHGKELEQRDHRPVMSQVAQDMKPSLAVESGALKHTTEGLV